MRDFLNPPPGIGHNNPKVNLRTSNYRVESSTPLPPTRVSRVVSPPFSSRYGIAKHIQASLTFLSVNHPGGGNSLVGMCLPFVLPPSPPDKAPQAGAYAVFLAYLPCLRASSLWCYLTSPINLTHLVCGPENNRVTGGGGSEQGKPPDLFNYPVGRLRKHTIDGGNPKTQAGVCRYPLANLLTPTAKCIPTRRRDASHSWKLHISTYPFP